MSTQMKIDTQTATQTSMLDISRVYDAPLQTDPYEYFIATDFIRPEWQERLIAGYPVLKSGGSFPLATVKTGKLFKALIEEMNGPEFRHAIEQKFSINLENRPTMFTVRGRCRQKDGKIHTDSESKMITVLLYMNPAWQNDGGRLRVLRNGTDIEAVAAEVPPKVGTLLVFKRSDKSWHGHLPFDGERKVIQMNWVTEQKYVDHEAKRHIWSALVKRLGFSY